MTALLRRILPWPRTTAFLLAIWLLLNQSVAPGQILLGAALATAIPWWTASLRPIRPRLHSRPWLALKLLGIVVFDSLKSNLEVARVVLGPRERRRNDGFVNVPLDLRNAHGLATLTMLMTAIPGTVCVELSHDRSTLTLHVLDLTDEQYWIDTVKNRYEKPLLEIFP